MPRKTKENPAPPFPDAPWTEWFTNNDLFDEMLYRTCLFVEAAGTIGRAERFGLFDGLEPEAFEVLRRVVPRSRGGEGAIENAEMVWGQWMIDVMEHEGGRQVVAVIRKIIEECEQELLELMAQEKSPMTQPQTSDP